MGSSALSVKGYEEIPCVRMSAEWGSFGGEQSGTPWSKFTCAVIPMWSREQLNYSYSGLSGAGRRMPTAALFVTAGNWKPSPRAHRNYFAAVRNKGLNYLHSNTNGS